MEEDFDEREQKKKERIDANLRCGQQDQNGSSRFLDRNNGTKDGIAMEDNGFTRSMVSGCIDIIR